MGIKKRSVRGPVIALAVFLCIMAGALWNPSVSPAQVGDSILHSFSGGASDGAGPRGGFTLVGSTLYGMTSGKGDFNYGFGDFGTIFQIGTDGNGYKVLHSFTGGSDGASPYGNLIVSGTTLYGMTGGGSVNDGGDYGTIFQIGTDGTGYKVLHNFDGGSGGANPNGSLTLVGSTLYGVTFGGGDYLQDNDGYSWGTIFQIGTDGTGYKVLYSFAGGSDGAYPTGSLTLYGSTLYGITYQGGAYNQDNGGYGTIFQIGTDGNGYQVLYSFTGESDGANPTGSLTLSGSTLYGATTVGGAYEDAGTIFQIGTDGRHRLPGAAQLYRRRQRGRS